MLESPECCGIRGVGIVRDDGQWEGPHSRGNENYNAREVFCLARESAEELRPSPGVVGKK